jgi:hypothetical protein
LLALPRISNDQFPNRSIRSNKVGPIWRDIRLFDRRRPNARKEQRGTGSGARKWPRARFRVHRRLEIGARRGAERNSDTAFIETWPIECLCGLGHVVAHAMSRQGVITKSCAPARRTFISTLAGFHLKSNGRFHGNDVPATVPHSCNCIPVKQV